MKVEARATGFAASFALFLGFLFGAIANEVGTLPWMVGMVVLTILSCWTGARMFTPILPKQRKDPAK